MTNLHLIGFLVVVIPGFIGQFIILIGLITLTFSMFTGGELGQPKCSVAISIIGVTMCDVTV